MTAFYNLPKEVFCLVLEQLDSDDLYECQQVCRSWYLPVHKKFLNTVHLKNVNQVAQFIASVDHNSDPQYLASVKHIAIREEHYLFPVQFRLDKSEIKKLFFRFSNLETIREHGDGEFLLYSELDDDLCEELLLSCPKLHEFSVTNEFVKCEQLLKLRIVLTEIDFSQLKSEPAYDNVAFISSFSRLKSIDIDSDNFDTFEKLLPLFEQLPNLTKLKIEVDHDQDNFAERYLASKSKNEQNLLIKRLATVTDLDWSSYNGLCKNAIKFIPKYLTGLKKILISVYPAYTSISTQQQHLLCNDMLDLFHSITHCDIYLKLENINLPEYLPIILHKINQHPSKTDEIKALKLLVERDYGHQEPTLAELCVKKEVTKSTLIIIKGKHSVDNFIKNVLSETTPLDDVDFFEFQYLDGEDIDYIIYEKFLNWIKSLKHVYLHVPPSFKETEPLHYTYDQEYDGNIYPQVEQLTIKADYHDVNTKPYSTDSLLRFQIFDN